MFLTKQFQRLMEKSNTKPLNIICVNSNVDAREHLKDLNSPIDILVATPFCFDEILKRLPRLFQSKRFQLVWFDEMDEMCKNNEAIVNSVVDVLYSHVNDIQVNIETCDNIYLQCFSRFCWFFSLRFWLHRNHTVLFSK